jgi:hypothetical protein
VSLIWGQELANDRGEFSFRADVQADEDSEHVRIIFFPRPRLFFRRQFFGAMAIWYGFAGNVLPAAKNRLGWRRSGRRLEIMLIGCDSG